MIVHPFQTQTGLHYMNPRLAVISSVETGGYGVVATGPLAEGEVLVVWGGKVTAERDFEQLPTALRTHSLQIEEGLYLVPSEELEPADYVNHSCDPNAGVRGQVTLVALREIQAGEQICFDYAMTDSSPYDEFDCRCGSPLCRGRVSGNDWMRPELQQRYAGRFAHYLQERIDRMRAESEQTTVLSAV